MKFIRRKGDQGKSDKSSVDTSSAPHSVPQSPSGFPDKSPRIAKRKLAAVAVLGLVGFLLLGQIAYVNSASHQLDDSVLDQQLSAVRASVNKPSKVLSELVQSSSSITLPQIQEKLPEARDLIVWDRRLLDQRYSDLSVAKASGFARLSAAERVMEDSTGKFSNSSRFYRPALGKETFLVLSSKNKDTVVQVLVPAKDILAKFQSSVPDKIPTVLLQNGAVVASAFQGENLDLSSYDVSTAGTSDLSVAMKLPTPPAYWLATPVLQGAAATVFFLIAGMIILGANRKPKLVNRRNKKSAQEVEPEPVSSVRVAPVVALPNTAPDKSVATGQTQPASHLLSLSDGEAIASQDAPPAHQGVPSGWFAGSQVCFTGHSNAPLPDSSQARSFMRALVEQVFGSDTRHASVLLVSDGRESSQHLARWFSEGLSACGCDVLNCPDMPLSVLPSLEALREAEHRVCVWVGSSSDNPEQTSVRIFENNKAWDEGQYSRWKLRIEGRPKPHHVANEGQETFLPLDDLIPSMISKMSSSMQTERPIRVVMDFGNGPLGVLAPEVLESVGIEVIPLHAEMDPQFPNRQARMSSGWPSLAATVKQFRAHFGVGLSIDGTGLIVIDELGQPVAPHCVFALLSADALVLSPGARVQFDPSVIGEGTLLAIQNAGGIPAPVENLSAFTDLPSGVPVSATNDSGFGVYRLAEDGGVPDAMHVVARLGVLLSSEESTMSERVSSLFGP